MSSQRDAVFTAVTAVVGEITGPVSLTKEQKVKVHELVVQSFLSGETNFKGEVTPEIIKKYTPGLVNNWTRKDPRLNGHTKYTPKNPGSRQGSGDESLKAMKQLLAITTDTTARSEIETEIAKRKLEIKPKPEIKVDALPEHLRKFAPKA